MTLDPESTYGPLFIGLLASAILLGTSTVQSGSFLVKNCGREPLLHRVVVGGLWILDFLSTCFLAHTLYRFLIVRPLSSDVLMDAASKHFIWTCIAIFAMEAIIISIAHSLYILRIWRLATLNGFRRPALLTTTLTVFSASSLVSGLYASYQLSLVSQLDGFQHLPAVVYSCLASTCVADFSISTVLIMLLIRRPKATSWTDSTVVMLASYALNTGIFTGVFSVASIVAYATRRSSYAFMGIRIILSTVHINSLMAMLNARRYFQKETPSTVVLQAHDAFLTFSKGGTIEASRRRPTTADRNAQPTINEAGFPQFDQATRTPCDVVEVVVAQERSTTVSRATHL